MRTVTSYQIAKARLRSMRNSGICSEGDYLNFLQWAKEWVKQGLDKPAVINGIAVTAAPIFWPMGTKR